MAMEQNPALEWEHFVAQKLSMTVERLRLEMSGQEFTSWVIYYQREAQRKQLASM